MKRKLKFSEFAELIGTTAKTVYKMGDRGEIITVIEKVNNRPTRLVVIDDEEIIKFKNIYSKKPVNDGNYEDIVTVNNDISNDNNYSESINSNEFVQEIFDKLIEINDTYNNKLSKLNDELITSRTKLLLLEDKANREGLYLAEINGLKEENEQLKNSKRRSLNISINVIIILVMVIISLITFNVLGK